MNLSPKIVLKTQRCTLRITKKKDIPFIFSATRYEGFNNGMLWDAPSTKAELIEPYENGLIAWRDRQSYSFTICHRFNDEPLGRINIRLESDQVWTTGFWLHPKEQGKGYMTESVAAILRLGFETLDADIIQAYYAVWNVKSGNVLRRVGMKFVEHISQGFQKKGEWVEQNKLNISKREWQELQQRPH